MRTHGRAKRATVGLTRMCREANPTPTGEMSARLSGHLTEQVSSRQENSREEAVAFLLAPIALAPNLLSPAACPA